MDRRAGGLLEEAVIVCGCGGGCVRGDGVLGVLPCRRKDDLVRPDTIDEADDTSTIVSSSEATSWRRLLDVKVVISGYRK